MFKYNKELILNPWKLGFVLIIIANVLFHTSTSFLLFLILFLIFLYAYCFLGFLFNDFAKGYSANVSGGFSSAFEASLAEMGASADVLVLLDRSPELAGKLLDLWTMQGLAYNCVPIPGGKNYFLSLLAQAHFLRGEFFFRDFFLLDSSNFQQRQDFCSGFGFEANRIS